MYGTRPAAARRIDENQARRAATALRLLRADQVDRDHVRVEVGRVPQLPRSRQGAIYAPPVDVRTGAQGGCATAADDPPGNLQLPCDGLSSTQPRPSGSGDVTVNAGATNTATISTVHPATVIDYGINDPSGVLLVTAITAGTDNLIEGGSIRTATWVATKTACPIQQPFAIYPWSGLVFSFSNTTAQTITVNCWALLRIRRC